LLGVRVVFTRNNGEKCQSEASFYIDSLTVDGYADAGNYDVELYSVGRNMNLSSPVKITVTVLQPPVKAVDLTFEEGFGGVVMSLTNNDTNADLAVVLLGDTVGSGNLLHLRSFYTRATNIKFAQRGLQPKVQKFGVFLRDRWGNKSDTIFKFLTPIEEEKLDKTIFTNGNLPGDSFAPFNGLATFALEKAWDIRDGIEVYTNGAYYASSFIMPMPQHFTINLGCKASISRFQMLPGNGREAFEADAPRVWELWGANNPSTTSSGWEDWHLLGEYSQFKPSGYGIGNEVGPIIDEDIEYFRTAGDYGLDVTDNCPDPQQIVTHVRFRTLSSFRTYGTAATFGEVVIGELTFFGKEIKD
jgi:PKD repeat protein